MVANAGNDDARRSINLYYRKTQLKCRKFYKGTEVKEIKTPKTKDK